MVSLQSGHFNTRFASGFFKSDYWFNSDNRHKALALLSQKILTISVVSWLETG
jgi:hypothetical protein